MICYLDIENCTTLSLLQTLRNQATYPLVVIANDNFHKCFQLWIPNIMEGCVMAPKLCTLKSLKACNSNSFDSVTLFFLVLSIVTLLPPDHFHDSWLTLGLTQKMDQGNILKYMGLCIIHGISRGGWQYQLCHPSHPSPGQHWWGSSLLDPVGYSLCTNQCQSWY